MLNEALSSSEKKKKRECKDRGKSDGGMLYIQLHLKKPRRREKVTSEISSTMVVYDIEMEGIKFGSK